METFDELATGPQETDKTAAAGGRQKWSSKLRGKIFSRDRERRASDRSQENAPRPDLTDFFNDRPDARLTEKRPLISLDVSAAQSEGVRDASLDPLEPFRFMKPRRREGLKVDFVVTVPEIIGFGGDDAELPPHEVARARPPAAQHVRTGSNDDVRTTRADAGDRRPSAMADLAVRRKPIGESPSGSQERDRNVSPQTRNLPRNGGLPSAQGYDLKRPDSAAFQDLRRMRADEGRAFVSARNSMSSQPDVDPLTEPGLRVSEPAESGHDSLTSARPPLLAPRPLSGNFDNSRPSTAGTDSSQERQTRGNYLSPPNSRLGQSVGATTSESPSPDYHSDKHGSPLDTNRIQARRMYLAQHAGQDSSSSIDSVISPSPKGGDVRPIPRSVAVDNTQPVLDGPSPLGGAEERGEQEVTERPGSRSPPNQSPPDQRRLSYFEDTAAREAALEDFVVRIGHMRHVFRLSAELRRPISTYSTQEWCRVALWWFLRGRAGLEQVVRNGTADGARNDNQSPSRQNVPALMQHHVNLAKTWWIVSEVIKPRLEEPDQNHEQEESRPLEYTHESIMVAFQKLALSMAKRHLLPPGELLTQGFDTSIWIEYPTYPPNTAWILSGNPSTSANEPIIQQQAITCLPVSDSETLFCYGRMFVGVTVFAAEDEEKEMQPPFPCCLSILREPTDLHSSLVIASQSQLVTVNVMNNNPWGPGWEHVRWEPEQCALRIKLPQRLRLRIFIRQEDYDVLKSHVDLMLKAAKGLDARSTEEVRLDMILSDLRYDVHTRNRESITERIKHSKARLFERFQDMTGNSRVHAGYRLAVASDLREKSVRAVSIDLRTPSPLEYDFIQDVNHKPGLRVRINERDRYRELAMVSRDPKQREDFLARLTGAYVAEDESRLARVALRHITFRTEGEAATFGSEKWSITLPFSHIDVICTNPDELSNANRSLWKRQAARMVASSPDGAVVNRLAYGTGELTMRLPNDGAPSIQIPRAARADFSASAQADLQDREFLPTLRRLMEWTASTPTVETYFFGTPHELHVFQRAVFGFAVLFDGVARSFAISRRRMVVPVYKSHDAANVRLQLVDDDGAFHLIAFFEDYHLARCMSVPLKSTDVFEQLDGKAGEPCIKLVDAKFALPSSSTKRHSGGSGEGDDASGKPVYLSLEAQEYPTEHEDITIGFANAHERDRFAEALPAATTVARKFTLKRRI